MKSTTSILQKVTASLSLIAALSVAPIGMADALILCVDSGGNVSVGVACKKGWTQLDPVAVDLQGPPGATGPRGPSNVFYTSGPFSATSLNTTDFSAVLTLSLPAGSYIVNAVAAAAAISSNETVQCVLLHGTPPNRAFGEDIQASFGGATNGFVTVPLSAPITLQAADHVAVGCRSGPNVVTQPGTISAIQVETVTTQ